MLSARINLWGTISPQGEGANIKNGKLTVTVLHLPPLHFTKRNVSTPITNPLGHEGFLNTSAPTLFLAKRFASGAKNEERH
ncbi:hypothetical protein, partial [Enterobacter intestinihominis]